MSVSSNSKLHRQIEALKSGMKERGYTTRTIESFYPVWNQLERLAERQGVHSYSPQFATKFLLDEYGIKTPYSYLAKRERHISRGISLLDHFVAHNRVDKYGHKSMVVWEPGYYEICEQYLRNLEPRQYAARTMHQIRVTIKQFTEHLKNSGIQNLDGITAKEIDTFIEVYRGYQRCTISRICNTLRGFLLFSFQAGSSVADKSLCVPQVQRKRCGNLPSVFTEEEIRRILAQVDRANPRGKRDYAILLLAVRYGIRGGDIRSLKLTDLNFEQRRISFVQGKTGNMIVFDMLEDIGWALIDYLKNGRSKAANNHVFLTLKAPYQEFAQEDSLWNIMAKYVDAAEISTENRHKGIHSLRHSLASRLLEQGNSLPVISQVLGHSELNSTMTYTKIDIAQLALCALEVPNVTM